MSVTITQLISYPIKSCAGIEHQSVTLGAMGLNHDRQFMLVDESGVFLSQRKYPQLALVQPRVYQHQLILTAPGMNELTVNFSTNRAPTKVNIWQDSLQAELCPPVTSQWFSQYLNKPARLVKYGSSSHRMIDKEYNPNNQTVAFADSLPLLITHEASLNHLNRHLASPVGMNRFRPNIVVSSDCQPWDELLWRSLSCDGYEIDLVKPCSRCVMTGINQITGVQTGSEVLKTLKREFAHQDKAVFGINAVINIKPAESIELSVGQILKLTDR